MIVPFHNTHMMTLWNNFKIFKNQHDEVFACYVGPNCRNGSPKKTIWVPNKIIESLLETVLLTMAAKNARYILEKARQNEYMHTTSNYYAHMSGKNFSAYIFI